jgi:hypothetical protein
MPLLAERNLMTLFKAATTVCFTALAAAILSPAAKADEWDQKTVITFSNPVEIPGVHLKGWGVLPAGTYVFKLLDSQSDRHIVQIFNKDQTTVYATILAIPNFRLKATDKTVMTFRETAPGEPESLRAWFYPGMNWGEEFVYPKAKAIELAKASDVPVLFTAVDMPLEFTEGILSVDAPVVANLKKAPIMAVQPTGEEVQVAEVVTPPPAKVTAAEPAPVEPEAALPHTASPMPLIGLVGLIALAGALAMNRIGKRV